MEHANGRMDTPFQFIRLFEAVSVQNTIKASFWDSTHVTEENISQDIHCLHHNTNRKHQRTFIFRPDYEPVTPCNRLWNDYKLVTSRSGFICMNLFHSSSSNQEIHPNENYSVSEWWGLMVIVWRHAWSRPCDVILPANLSELTCQHLLPSSEMVIVTNVSVHEIQHSGHMDSEEQFLFENKDD